MGLDMTLEKRTFIGGQFHHRKVEGTVKLSVQDELLEFNPKKIDSIIENVAYWRKANAIHAWFVDNTQEGNDTCLMSQVPFDKLMELKKLCEKVLTENDENVSRKLLPTRQGFFFGSNEYEAYYYENVKQTLTLLESLKDDGDYFYQASW